MENKLFTVEEVLSRNGGYLPMSRSGVYNAIRRKEIPVVEVGRRKFIPSWFIENLLYGQYQFKNNESKFCRQ